MNQNPRNRIQDLREAFASIISMMLGLLRAQGLRGLVYLPEVWLATRAMKRIAEEFCALFAAWAGGFASTPAPQPRQAAPAPSRPATSRRPHIAPPRAHACRTAQPPEWRARGRRAYMRHRDHAPPRRSRDRSRCSGRRIRKKNSVLAALSWHADFVTISKHMAIPARRALWSIGGSAGADTRAIRRSHADIDHRGRADARYREHVRQGRGRGGFLLRLRIQRVAVASAPRDRPLHR